MHAFDVRLPQIFGIPARLRHALASPCRRVTGHISSQLAPLAEATQCTARLL